MKYENLFNKKYCSQFKLDQLSEVFGSGEATLLLSNGDSPEKVGPSMKGALSHADGAVVKLSVQESEVVL